MAGSDAVETTQDRPEETSTGTGPPSGASGAEPESPRRVGMGRVAVLVAAVAFLAAAVGWAIGSRGADPLNAADADGDALTYTVVRPPEHGQVVVEGDGAFTYTPVIPGQLTDTFTVTASDAGSGFHLHGLLGLVNLLTFGGLGLFLGYQMPEEAESTGDWKLVDGRGSGGFTAPRTIDPAQAGGPPGQLYHLGDDPSETRNIWEQHPDKVRELLALLERIRGDD